MHRPESLDPSFDDIIDDSVTVKLSTKEKLAYMEARTLSERERIVIREGGYIIGKEDGFAEGMEKGRVQGILESAGRLLAAGMSKVEVARLLNLDVEQLKDF